MAGVPVEVNKGATAEAPASDVWRSFRSEMHRLFDRFGFPSLRRMREIEPAWRAASSFSLSAPPIDMAEDDKAYKITVELPGLDAKDVDLSISGKQHARTQGIEAPGERGKEQELLFLRAILRLVSACLRTPGECRSRQGRRRLC